MIHIEKQTIISLAERTFKGQCTQEGASLEGVTLSNKNEGADLQLCWGYIFASITTGGASRSCTMLVFKTNDQLLKKVIDRIYPTAEHCDHQVMLLENSHLLGMVGILERIVERDFFRIVKKNDLIYFKNIFKDVFEINHKFITGGYAAAWMYLMSDEAKERALNRKYTRKVVIPIEAPYGPVDYKKDLFRIPEGFIPGKIVSLGRSNSKEFIVGGEKLSIVSELVKILAVKDEKFSDDGFSALFERAKEVLLSEREFLDQSQGDIPDTDKIKEAIVTMVSSGNKRYLDREFSKDDTCLINRADLFFDGLHWDDNDFMVVREYEFQRKKFSGWASTFVKKPQIKREVGYLKCRKEEFDDLSEAEKHFICQKWGIRNLLWKESKPFAPTIPAWALEWECDYRDLTKDSFPLYYLENGFLGWLAPDLTNLRFEKNTGIKAYIHKISPPVPSGTKVKLKEIIWSSSTKVYIVYDLEEK